MDIDALWTELASRARELRALESLSSLAGWDQETFMPPGGGDARAQQQAVLRGIIHERLTSPRLGEVLECLASSELDGERQALVRVLRYERDRAVRVPSRLVKAIAEAQGRGVEAWREARATNDFSLFRPHLEHLITLRREQASALGHTDEPYDALLQNSEPGMTTARLRPVMERLREGLTPLVAEVASRPPVEAGFLSRDAWDVDAQYAYGCSLAEAIGFDFRRGRLDRSVHPFCSGFSPGDVRMTTRLFRDNGASGLFALLHETGHGLYEQGLPCEGTPLCAAPSMAIHESQSRLWENFVGRSRAFWLTRFDDLRRRFPSALEGVNLDRWVDGINRAQPSLIRVEADELTYNLHILVRFELELDILHGRLDAQSLPEAWSDRYERFLGIRPAGAAAGILQDIHWAWGEFGYFPTYTLGNMYAATLMKAAQAQIPGLWEAIAAGDTRPLLAWLREKVHSRGRLAEAEDIVRDATGSGLTEVDLLAYLRGKFLA